MADLITVHHEIRALLEQAGVHCEWGPATSLPLREDGQIDQAAVLWPTPGTGRTRHDPRLADRVDTVTITCVGATSTDSLVVVDQVRTALTGVRLAASGANGGTLHEPDGMLPSPPAPEPGAGPVRVSTTLTFLTVTKGP